MRDRVREDEKEIESITENDQLMMRYIQTRSIIASQFRAFNDSNSWPTSFN